LPVFVYNREDYTEDLVAISEHEPWNYKKEQEEGRGAAICDRLLPMEQSRHDVTQEARETSSRTLPYRDEEVCVP
jgi:hypothetical protein